MVKQPPSSATGESELDVKILVCGSRGFIGSALWPLLECDGHQVWHGPRPVNDMDLVIDLAWRGVSGRDDGQDVSALCDHLHRLEWYATCRAKRIITVGSCFENVPAPNPLYGVSKKSLSEVAAAFCRARSIGHAHLRVFHVFGPRQHESALVPSVILSRLRQQPLAIARPHARCDYLHVESVARLIGDIAVHSEVGTINLCSGIFRTVQSIADDVTRQMDGQRPVFGQLDFADTIAYYRERYAVV